MIIGRRGSGKTSLTKYLEFQPAIKNTRYIDVDEPLAYDELFREIASTSYAKGDLLELRLVKLWDYIIWSLIFNKYKADDPLIHAACIWTDRQSSPTRLIADILKHLLSRFIQDGEGVIADQIEQFFGSGTFAHAKEKVLALTAKQPVIIAIDTVERYEQADDRLMAIVCSLIQSASHFNLCYAARGIHLKAFIAAEIFPHVKESAIPNTTKYIQNPVYLHWRPRDLIRLICWRFYRHLDQHRQLPAAVRNNIDWEDFGDVISKMWLPYFGHNLTNGGGVTEKTFPYVLRHTQMRPRQLVELCNKIARCSIQSGSFPDFQKTNIVQVVKQVESDLAAEVLNSYALIYPKVGDIVNALHASPMIFSGSYLDKVAKQTIAAWPKGTYSPENFRKLVAELGIVGRVRSQDEHTKIAAADFEYTLDDRLPLNSHDTCVIHPMFYTRLHTQISRPLVVYPFPDHPDFELLRESIYATR